MGIALLTAFHYLGSVDELVRRARGRTYQRLLPLNEFLNRQIDKQWAKTPSDDVIPDVETLLALKYRVENACVIEDKLNLRTRFEELGRAAAALQLVAAILIVGLVATGTERQLLTTVATLVAALLLGLTLLALVAITWLRLQVSHGSDRG